MKRRFSPSFTLWSLTDEAAEHWENGSIEDFLAAASAWAVDSEFGSTQGLSSASPWRKFATFLYCGKIYE